MIENSEFNLDDNKADCDNSNDSTGIYFHQFFDSHDSVALLIDGTDLRIIDFNRAALDFYGFAEDVFSEMKLSDFTFHSNDNPVDRIDDLKKGSNIRQKLKDGSLRYVELSRSTFTDCNSKYILLIVSDITGIYVRDSGLELKAEWLEAIFQSTLSGLIIIEKKTHRIVDINQAALDMIQSNKEQVVGMLCHNFVCPANLFNCPVTDLNQQVKNQEKILYRTDGSKMNILKSVSELDIGGNSYLIESIIDIDTRKEIENKFRNIFESIDDLYYQSDLDGKITLLSPSVLKITGWTQEELTGKYTSEVYVNPLDRLQLVETLQREGSVKDYELLLKKKDGSPINASMSGSIIFNTDGNPIGVRGLLRDITERKKLENIQEYFHSFRNLLLSLSERFVTFSVNEIDEVFDSVLYEVGTFFNIDRSYIFMFNWKTGTMSNTNEWCAYGIPSEIENLQNISNIGLAVWVNELLAFRPIYIPDVSELEGDWTNVQSVLEEQNIKSLVVVPITYYQNVLGFIGFDSVVKHREWHEEEIALLSILANNISKAIVRKQTEEALINSEERYRYLSENMADVVWVIDLQHMKFQYISPSVEKLLGHPAQDLIAQPIEKTITPESFKLMKEDVLKRVNQFKQDDRSAITSVNEIEQICRDGRVIISEIVSTLNEDDKGNFILIGVSRNITNRKAIENALKENEKRLNMFFSMSLDGFFFMMLDRPVRWDDSVDKEAVLDYVFDHQRITEINDAMLRHYRAQKDEFLGLTPNDVFKNNIAFGRNIWRQLFDEGNLHIETDERRMDGSHMWIEGDYTCLLDEEGMVIGHFGVQRDVTERKKAEEEINKLLTGIEQSPVSIIITNIAGNIEYVNPKGIELTGYTVDELLGKKPNILKNDYYPHEYSTELWNHINSGQTWQGEFYNQKKDGDFFWVLASVSPIRNNDGEITHLIVIQEDITDRKKTDEELNELLIQLSESHKIIEENLFEKNSLIVELTETQEKLEKSNSEKDKFFSIIAHDLRNPFFVLLTNSELIETYYEKMDDEKRLKLIKGMKEASKFTYSLLENLLLWSRAQMGTFKINPAKVQMSELMEKLASYMKSQAGQKSIRLVFNCAPDIVPYCDRDMIDTVLRNLVSNAIKFSNQGEMIEIEAKESGEYDNFYLISVKDHGVGIPEDQLAKLFSLAENVSTKGTNNEKGSGLGLILCKEFIEMNDGKLWVESKEGNGSTFFFTLLKNERNAKEENN